MAGTMNELKKAFLARPKRDQQALWLLLIALIYLLWDLLLFSPLQKSIDLKEAQISRLQQEMATTPDFASLQAVSSEERALETRINQLKNTAAQMNTELDLLTASLISPARMTQVLQDVLQQEARLKLVKVANFPAVKITNAANPDQSNLYRHSVEFVLEGEFLDTLEYLKKLEALPWTMGWSELSYQVLDYPQAQIRLRINTLSTEVDWIGA